MGGVTLVVSKQLATYQFYAQLPIAQWCFAILWQLSSTFVKVHIMKPCPLPPSPEDARRSQAVWWPLRSCASSSPTFSWSSKQAPTILVELDKPHGPHGIKRHKMGDTKKNQGYSPVTISGMIFFKQVSLCSMRRTWNTLCNSYLDGGQNNYPKNMMFVILSNHPKYKQCIWTNHFDVIIIGYGSMILRPDLIITLLANWNMLFV